MWTITWPSLVFGHYEQDWWGYSLTQDFSWQMWLCSFRWRGRRMSLSALKGHYLIRVTLTVRVCLNIYEPLQTGTLNELLLNTTFGSDKWLGAARQQAITRAYGDPDLCPCMVTLGHNELISIQNKWISERKPLFEAHTWWVTFIKCTVMAQCRCIERVNIHIAIL